MCEQIVKFCSGSTKPLLYVGSFLTLLLAVAIGYTGCSQHVLFMDIDVSVAQEKSLLYYLQLLTAGYLLLVALLTAFAAHYDQKHSIRALTIITSINFVLAAGLILMVPPGNQLGGLFSERLKNATILYDFTDKSDAYKTGLNGLQSDDTTGKNSNNNNNNNNSVPPKSNEPENNSNGQQSQIKDNTKPPSSYQAESSKPAAQLTKFEATKTWDALQNRGCCGYQNATQEWKSGFPKSCCAQPINDDTKLFCKEIDQQHAKSCACIVESTSLNLLIVLALIALVNLYLATILGVNAYRTFHYNEASQNAYT